MKVTEVVDSVAFYVKIQKNPYEREFEDDRLLSWERGMELPKYSESLK